MWVTIGPSTCNGRTIGANSTPNSHSPADVLCLGDEAVLVQADRQLLPLTPTLAPSDGERVIFFTSQDAVVAVGSQFAFVTFSVPANFRAVTAVAHVAPTAAVIFAAIDEEPPAIIAL